MYVSASRWLCCYCSTTSTVSFDPVFVWISRVSNQQARVTSTTVVLRSENLGGG